MARWDEYGRAPDGTYHDAPRDQSAARFELNALGDSRSPGFLVKV